MMTVAAPRTWILALPLPGAAYRFAHHRPELQSWIVLGNPRVILPRYRGWLRRREAA